MGNIQKIAASVGVVVVGVLIAGYVMSAMRGNAYIDMAHDGYDG